MILKVFTDGGSKGNPGPSAIGIVGYVDDKELFRHREDIGIATNNVAEYRAVLTAMSKLKTQVSNLKGVEKIHFFSDSQLVVNQLNGLYKVKNAAIREFIARIRVAEAELDIPITYSAIPREKNSVADALVNNK